MGGDNKVAGKVDYPTYKKTFHRKLLTNLETDNPNMSITDLLNDAMENSPYDGWLTYTGRTLVGTPPLTVAQAIGESLSMDFDPVRNFSEAVDASATSLPLSLTSLTEYIEKLAFETKKDYEQTKAVLMGNAISNGTVFSCSMTLNNVTLLNSRLNFLMWRDLEESAKTLLQRNEAIVSNALGITELQLGLFSFSRSVYAMAVEACKLRILDEREYFNQTIFYIKYSAHWRSECFQEAFNAIGAWKTGKYLVKIKAADLPMWAQTLGLITYAGAADPVEFALWKNGRRFRHVASQTGLGFGMGALTALISGPLGSAGALIGGIGGMLNGIFSYKTDEWR